MLLAAFYVFAIAAIILHYTGHLKRWNCEWILIVLHRGLPRRPVPLTSP